MSLLFLKTKDSFKNNAGMDGQNGLTYNTTVLEDLLKKDSDSDGAMDWEESLLGTDPQNKDSDGDGVLDGKEKVALDAENLDVLNDSEEISVTPNSETDKFSQELAATIAAISETGEMDQATVEQLSSNLLEQIATRAPNKVYGPGDLKIVAENSVSIQSYNNALNSIFPKTMPQTTVVDILQKSIDETGEVDGAALSELDPIIKKTEEIISGLVKASVPTGLAPLHLSVINDMQRLLENLQDVQAYETDAIIALSGMGQYETNASTLAEDAARLAAELNNKMGQF